MADVNLTVDPEIQAMGQALTLLINDVRAKKSILVDVSDTFMALMGAIGGLNNAAVDIMKSDNEAYLLLTLRNALGMPAATTASATAKI